MPPRRALCVRGSCLASGPHGRCPWQALGVGDRKGPGFPSGRCSRSPPFSAQPAGRACWGVSSPGARAAHSAGGAPGPGRLARLPRPPGTPAGRTRLARPARPGLALTCLPCGCWGAAPSFPPLGQARARSLPEAPLMGLACRALVPVGSCTSSDGVSFLLFSPLRFCRGTTHRPCHGPGAHTAAAPSASAARCCRPLPVPGPPRPPPQTACPHTLALRPGPGRGPTACFLSPWASVPQGPPPGARAGGSPGICASCLVRFTRRDVLEVHRCRSKCRVHPFLRPSHSSSSLAPGVTSPSRLS